MSQEKNEEERVRELQRYVVKGMIAAAQVRSPKPPAAHRWSSHIIPPAVGIMPPPAPTEGGPEASVEAASGAAGLVTITFRIPSDMDVGGSNGFMRILLELLDECKIPHPIATRLSPFSITEQATPPSLLAGDPNMAMPIPETPGKAHNWELGFRLAFDIKREDFAVLQEHCKSHAPAIVVRANRKQAQGPGQFARN